MHPYKYIEISSKRFPISEIEDATSPTSLAIAKEIRLATCAPTLLRSLQKVASEGGTMQGVFARTVLIGLGFPTNPEPYI